MNAAQLNTSLLIDTLAKFTRKPLLGDVMPEHLSRLQLLFPDARASTPVSEILPRIEKAIWRQERAAKAKHWSFDSNRLIALQLFASVLKEG